MVRDSFNKSIDEYLFTSQSPVVVKSHNRDTMSYEVSSILDHQLDAQLTD